jgi:glycosyltransferase involved in cell wall biosynthesis
VGWPRIERSGVNGFHLCLLGDANSVHVQRWATEMLARGCRVSVITARPAAVLAAEQRSIAPVSTSVDWLFRISQTRRHLEMLAPDIVHAHYITSYGYLAARCARHPLVMTAWGSDILLTPRQSRLKRWLTKWSLRQADLITGDSMDLIAEIAAYRPAAKVRQVHWGVDMSRFRPSDWAAKPAFDVVSLRSWEPNYNIDVIVEAFALFCRHSPHNGAHLHLLGGGSGEAALRAQLRELDIESKTTLHGRVDDAAMAAMLSACKVSISVPDSDATSVSVLESMASGLSVVASDLPANRQWLEGDDGVLVRAGDAAALARVLERLSLDDECAKDVGRRNHARMIQSGDRAVQMDLMLAMYEELLRDARGQPRA